MASSDSADLAPLSPAEFAGLAAVWLKASPAFAVHVVDPVHVLSLRHLPGSGTLALAAAMTALALPGLPEPGCACGSEPRLIWRSPNEILLMTQDAAQASALVAELRPAQGALACALDVSAGTLMVKLQGDNVEALLSRLVDARALPRGTDQVSRVRLADIAAVVWRDAPDHVGLLVDRANGHYLARWLSYAADAI